MNRQELTALRDAIDLTLALPDSVREMLAHWLTPATAKPNGHDAHPPVPTPTPRAAPTPRPAASKPHAAKRKIHDNPANARSAERRLLAAMRDRPGASVETLAEIVGAGRSTCGERLRRLAGQELIEKDQDGRWRVKTEEPRPTAPREEPGPTPPPSS
jgi:DNA-binding transcriptional ArsR family regulator